MDTFADFSLDMGATPSDRIAKLKVNGGTIMARLVVTGDEDLDGACIEIEPIVKSLPEGWSIDAAREAIAGDLRSYRIAGWGVSQTIRHAVRTGAASLELPARNPLTRPVLRAG